jgi:hypothetical protein
VPKGKGCEIDAVSNFSGWQHNDQGEFKKRVDEAMVTQKKTTSSQDAKATDPAKPQ